MTSYRLTRARAAEVRAVLHRPRTKNPMVRKHRTTTTEVRLLTPDRATIQVYGAFLGRSIRVHSAWMGPGATKRWQGRDFL